MQPGGRVYGIEHVPELVAFSKRNLDADAETRKLVAARAITIVVGHDDGARRLLAARGDHAQPPPRPRPAAAAQEGDGRLGFPSAAPFDAIHVGAAAPTIPQVSAARVTSYV